MDAFRSLEERILVHVVYARVFDDVLTRAELARRCGSERRAPVDDAVESLVAIGRLEQVGDLVFLPGEADLTRVGELESRERYSREILEDNQSLLRFLERLPWIRMLGISGSLAHGRAVDHPGKPADLDLCLVVEPGSVHIVRFLVRLIGIFRRVTADLGLQRPRAKPCPNYITEADFLEVSNPSFYTASDAVRLMVTTEREEYERFLRANPWIRRYYAVPIEEDEPRRFAPKRPWGRQVVNFACYMSLSVSQRIKRFWSGHPSTYSVGFRFDREHTLPRTAQAGGGHQVAVARRFRQIYRHHFGVDEELEAFLFPGTSDTGVLLGDVEVQPTLIEALGYGE